MIYEHEVPFELRVQQVADAPQEVGTLEAVKVKILLLGPEESPSAVRVELTSENDLFFHYSHTLDEAGFRAVQACPSPAPLHHLARYGAHALSRTALRRSSRS